MKSPDPLYLIPLLLLVVGRSLMAFWIPYAAEDAYITFRYAANLAHGYGLVWNIGAPPVYGFTSLPWALWNALGILLTDNPVTWARGAALLADMGALVLLTRLLVRHASRASAWAFSLFFACWPYFCATSMSGMETSLLVFLCAAAASSGRWLAVLSLWRPEGVVMSLVLGFYATWRWRFISAAVCVAAWLALNAYFGSPIPQSMIAKAQTYGTPGLAAVRQWWEWLVPLRPWPKGSDMLMLLPLLAVMLPAIVAGLPVVWKARRTPLAGFVFAALSVWAGYALLGVTYFSWYLVLPLAGFGVLAAVGLPRLVRHPLLYVSLVLYLIGGWWSAKVLYPGRSNTEIALFGSIADYMGRHSRAGERALMEPIGIIGYRMPGLQIIDEIGLVSPAIIERRKQGPGWYADAVNVTQPNWLVVRGGQVTSGAAFSGRGAPFRSDDERVSLFDQYELVMYTGGNDNDLRVYRKTQKPPAE